MNEFVKKNFLNNNINMIIHHVFQLRFNMDTSSDIAIMLIQRVQSMRSTCSMHIAMTFTNDTQ